MGKPFDILAADYRPMVLAYLRAVLGDEHLAEDLTQETFLAAHHNLSSFEPGRCFGAWLRGIARNKALEDRRAAARHPMLVDSCVVDGMEEVYGLFDGPKGAAGAGPWQERVARVRQCIAQLSDKLRGAVVAVYERGQSLREAAAALGASAVAVAKRVSRARDLIRQCVERSRQSTEQEVQHVRAE